MKLKWSENALNNLVDVYKRLASEDQRKAAHTAHALIAAPARLVANPRLGERLETEEYEVRRILVGRYEMRYDIREAVINVVSLWHTREER